MMPAENHHQPIGFVCCHCRYRSSGSLCSNPYEPDCPHRTVPRCRDCPILFTAPSPSSSRLSRGLGGRGASRTTAPTMGSDPGVSREQGTRRHSVNPSNGSTAASRNSTREDSRSYGR
ncbi:hypothetical protein GGS23DRAFT_549394 [Durotheca rogersii]|uniref:uncharacterized protein n=1 Tax=Durotheca rogersii TaxID=419775 RepID=UPI00221E6719|nr:uncharacterized protein GGS23DRAFT_549394 [Durotheca rogersii]KAI5867673.1 hypothetical protein GGS23DRAFT_549394 [Durotheca rogersii]